MLKKMRLLITLFAALAPVAAQAQDEAAFFKGKTVRILVRGPSGAVDRILGLYAPMATLSFATDEPRLLTARVSIGVGEAPRPPLALAAVGGRRIA